MKKSPEVRKVERALAKCAPAHKVQGFVVGACVIDGKHTFMRMARCKWAGIYNGEDVYDRLEGSLAGAYSVVVYYALDALERLKLISNDESWAFHHWLRAEDAEIKTVAKVRQLHALAKELGYKVEMMNTTKVKT
jgi:hypothetical protein